jgi:hypothetical protein
MLQSLWTCITKWKELTIKVYLQSNALIELPVHPLYFNLYATTYFLSDAKKGKKASTQFKKKGGEMGLEEFAAFSPAKEIAMFVKAAASDTKA